MSRFPDLRTALAVLVFSLAIAAPAAAEKLGIGRALTPEELKGWDIAVRPDGHGAPSGKGTAAQGEEIFQAQCASCHGEFGEGKDRWPTLAGGHGTLKHDRPEKTVGSYWPYASTVFDYIKRAMPFGNAQSLSNDEVYALTAYVLQLNDVVTDPKFELNAKTMQAIKMPNAAGFYDDDRETAEKSFWNRKPCMKDCKKDATVLNRARMLDVTPDSKSGPKVD
jgi:S-disulfanyl-L-cysteine oxidoreductase SoxD